MYLLTTMGRLGAAVAGTDPCSTGGHPKLSKEKRRLQMNKFRFTLKIAAIATFMVALASMAQGQATRTWVSGVGDDANPCSRTAPCKTFAGAISKTATAGIIDVLDPGGFGAVTITKSITIDGGPFEAGVLNNLSSGIIINGPAGTIVALRHLDIEGLNGGTIGINILGADRVTVEDCEVYGFKGGTARGLSDTRSTGGGLNVHNVTFRDNGSGAVIAPTAGGIGATFNECRFFSNTSNGLVASNGANVTVERSVADVNGAAGFRAEGATTSTMTVMRCRSTNNGQGIQAATGGVVRVGDSQVTDNAAALSTTGGTIASWGNNYVIGSGSFNGTALTFS
jgi:hypothetical protein